MSRDTRRQAKRRAAFLGVPLLIEIERGDTVSGTGDEGERWEKTYLVPYGEVERTEGEDGDAVDVYVGPFEDPRCPVFVVHQLRKDGTPDEDKVMLGFPGRAEARDAYELHGPPWGFGSMDEMTIDQFKHGYLAACRAPAPQLYNSAAAREAAGKARYGT